MNMNINIIVSIIVSTIFTLSVCFYVFTRITRYKKFETIDWFLIFISIFYGIGFCFVIIATHYEKNTEGWSKWILQYDSFNILKHITITSMFVYSVILGWNVICTLNKRNILKKIKNNISIEEKRDIYLKNSKKVAWIMFLIGIVSYFFYCRAYGGFIGLLSYSSAIRSGMNTVYNPLSFLQRFGEFTLFASYVFYGLILEANISGSNINIKNKIGFIVSFISSICILYSLLGRVGIVIYICTFLLSKIILKSKKISLLIIKIMLLSIVAIIGLTLVSSILGRATGDIDIIGMFTKELSFPFASFIAQSQVYSYRWFFDILVFPIYILPMRVWGSTLNIKTASSFNTFIMSGSYKGMGGVTGEIPVDIITFSNMQAPIIGVVIVGFLWGITLYILKIIIDKIPSIGIKSTIYSNIILNVLMMSVLYGDTQHIIVRNFSLIAGGMLIWLMMKINKKSTYYRINKTYKIIQKEK